MTPNHSEDQYRSVVEDQTELISRISTDGTFLFVNEVYCRFFGKASEQLLGNNWQPAAHPDDLPMIEAKLATLTPEHPVVIVENRVYSGTGEVHWVQWANRGFFDDRGRLREIQCVGRDISDLKRAEEALRLSEERLSLALSASHMGVWDLDVKTERVYWSPECFRVLAMDDFDGTLEGFKRVMHPDDIPGVMVAAERSLAQDTDFMAEFRIIRPDGEIRWLSDHGRPVYDETGNPVRLAGTVLDITERKRAEEDLRQLHEKMSDLHAHLETVREQERLAISREIHDEIGQALTALKLDLAYVNHRIQPVSGEVGERLAAMRSAMDGLIAKAQHITAELRPPLLDNLGLGAAIEWQVRQFRQRSGIDCQFIPPAETVPLDSKTATAAMRIFQEAMTNILRHAKATQVQVSLYYGPGSLELEVADNGTGISPDQMRSTTAYGVMGMQERARLCQGELEISGRPGKGTTVSLTLPLWLGCNGQVLEP
jgi:two-component system, NarL family, sensor histidine kinase UhpB